MTLVELVIVIGILGIIMVAVASFQTNILTNNRYSFDSLSSAQDARAILRTIVRELRSTSPGNNGSYAISTAATSTIVFYSDTNGDGIKEQIRYFIATTTLKKGVIIPTGSPLVYNTNNENITILAYNVRNSTSSPLFEYFNENYSGTGSPLTQPVVVTSISLIKISLLIDSNPNKAPALRTYTSQVNLRNLKDNL